MSSQEPNVIFECDVASFGKFDQVLGGIPYGDSDFGGIDPFTCDDVKEAIGAKHLEATPMNSYQPATGEAHANQQYLRDYQAAKAKGQDVWHAWFRDYHIRRIAWLVVHGIGDEPIILRQDRSRVDGNHRLLAAICIGTQTIKCIYEKTEAGQ